MWFCDTALRLVERFGIDGFRFDARPITTSPTGRPNADTGRAPRAPVVWRCLNDCEAS